MVNMIDFIKDWFIQIVSVIIMISVVQKVILEETIRKVATFIGGLILLVVFLQPIPKVKNINWELEFEKYQTEFERKKDEFALQTQSELADKIEKRMVDMIEEYARARGHVITAQVEFIINEEGIPLPERVNIKGAFLEELSLWIESEFAVSQDHQTWTA